MKFFHKKNVLEGSKEIAATMEPDGEALGLKQSDWKRITRFFTHNITLIVSGILLLLVGSTAIALLVYTWDNQQFARGVVISGLEMGDLTQEEAKETLEGKVNAWLTQSIQLESDGETITSPLESLGASVEIDSILNEAYAVGRSGSIFDKAKNKYDAAKNGAQFDLVPSWDDQTLTESLTTQLSQFNTAPVDASFTLNKENLMDIQSEQTGRSVELDPLISDIKKTAIFNDPGQLKVTFKEEKPSLTAAQLEGEKIDGLVASYTTWFDPNLVERSENVRIAGRALDGALIKPGETLSFNGIVGERTLSKGYKDAYIIVNGEFVPGLAGGICQVSSTLYNVGLLANLSIAQRSNHSLAISYAPLGQDATVAYPNLDLKMNNDTGGYLLIRTQANRNSLVINFYGKTKAGQQVFITNRTESVIPAPVQTVKDETLAPGEEKVKQAGQPGYVVTSTRTVKQDGVTVKTESLGKSTYEPLPKIVAVGP